MHTVPGCTSCDCRTNKTFSGILVPQWYLNGFFLLANPHFSNRIASSLPKNNLTIRNELGPGISVPVGILIPGILVPLFVSLDWRQFHYITHCCLHCEDYHLLHVIIFIIVTLNNFTKQQVGKKIQILVWQNTLQAHFESLHLCRQIPSPCRIAIMIFIIVIIVILNNFSQQQVGVKSQILIFYFNRYIAFYYEWMRNEDVAVYSTLVLQCIVSHMQLIHFFTCDFILTQQRVCDLFTKIIYALDKFYNCCNI